MRWRPHCQMRWWSTSMPTRHRRPRKRGTLLRLTVRRRTRKRPTTSEDTGGSPRRQTTPRRVQPAALKSLERQKHYSIVALAVRTRSLLGNTEACNNQIPPTATWQGTSLH